MTESQQGGQAGEGRAGGQAGASSGAHIDMATLTAALKEDRLDAVLERRTLRRRLFRWRIVAVIAIIAALIAAFGSWPDTGPRIARVAIDGVITDDRRRDALFDSLARDDDVKAVIVRINSPGGTTAGGEALFGALERLSAEKPVVAVMGEVAASAAYMAALATNHIIARGNTTTGSIGVIVMAPNVHGALESLGVSVVEVRSGDRKADLASYRPVDEADLAAWNAYVDESFQWFLALVRERRELSASTVALIRDGRVVTGRRALELGLIDALGGEREALAWLEKEHGVDASTPVVDRRPARPRAGLFGRVTGLVLGDDRALALDALIDEWTGGPRLMSILR